MRSNDSSLTLKGCFIWSLCVFFFLYEFLLRTLIGTFQISLMNEFEISLLKYSILSTSGYLIIHCLMQIPSGILVNIFGLKKVLFIAALVCGFSSIGFASTSIYSLALFFRITTAMGASVVFVALVIVILEWMPNKYFAFILGVSQFIGTLGPLIAAGPVNSFLEHSSFGWRDVMFFLGIVGLVLSIFIFIFVKNKAETTGIFRIIQRPVKIRDSLKKVLTNRQIWYISIFSAMAYFSIEYLSENDGIQFLHLKGFSLNLSSYMISSAWLGYAIGCPFVGFISDYFQRRKFILITGAIVNALSMAVIIYLPNGILNITCFFLLGIGASSINISFAMIAEHLKAGYNAIGIGFTNGMLAFFMAFNAPCLAYLIEVSDKVQEAPLLQDYRFAFSFLLLALIFVILLPLFLIKETYCRSMVELTILNRDSLSKR